MLYRLSYLWYTLVGATVSMAVALLVSFLTKPLDPRDVDGALLAPFVRRLIPPRQFPNQPNVDDIIYAYENTVSYTIKYKFIKIIQIILGAKNEYSEERFSFE